MSVIQTTRKEGLEYSQENIQYTFEEVECIVNQTIQHPSGTLYLTQEYLIYCIRLRIVTWFSFLVNKRIIRLFLNTNLLVYMQ